MTAHATTLAHAIWPATSTTRRHIRAVGLVMAACLVLAIAAQVRIPFQPVPFTMQTFVVLVVGLTYGPRLAAATMLTYLSVGATGAPVFAGAGAGMGVLTGTTGGFLLGMLAASVLLGLLGARGWTRTRTRTLMAMLAGTVVIFGLGVGWLATLVGWQTAVTTGLLPFLASEAAKIVLASAVVPTMWRFAGADGRGSR